MKQKNGKCPGDLTDDQWDSVERAANSLSRSAKARTLALLYEGRIHATKDAGAYGVVKSVSKPNDLFISTTANNGASVFDNRPLLAHTLAHESQHIVQGTGMDLRWRILDALMYTFDAAYRNATEDDAEQYACQQGPSGVHRCK